MYNLSASIKYHISRSIKFVKTLPFRLGSDRYCPVCNNSSRKFGKQGIITRKDAQCTWCGTLERHRLIWLYFRKMTDLLDSRPKKMLHVAPEPVFRKLFSAHLGADYLSADLHNPLAMVKMDVTDIKYPNESFDVIYCSHVLEHVPNDRRAIQEFFRVLKSDGWAILLVPITSDKTIEDPSIVDPADRLKHFGHEGHVRQYGPDYVERLIEAGFKVKIVAPDDFLNKEEITHMGITKAAGEVYYCRK